MDPKKRKERTEKRRRAIVGAAMGIVAQAGPDGLTVASLADILDLTPGALYRYFPSKDHILAGVEQAVIGEIAGLFASVVEATRERTALEQVVALVDAYFLLESQGSPHFQILSHFLTSSRLVLPDELAAEVMTPALQLFASLAGVLAGAAEAGDLATGNSLERAMILWSAIHGILERRKLSRLAAAAIDIRHLYRTTAESLLMGWGASRQQLDSIWQSHLPKYRTHYLPYLEAVA